MSYKKFCLGDITDSSRCNSNRREFEVAMESLFQADAKVSTIFHTSESESTKEHIDIRVEIINKEE